MIPMKLSGCLYVDDDRDSLQAIDLCKNLEKQGLMKCEIVHVTPLANTLRAKLETRLGLGLFLPMLELPTLGNYSGYNTIKAFFDNSVANGLGHVSPISH